ncbi:GNAT family N-acetyltransferase [Sporosarcina sp. HYO08]|uniref:GNAT family N-acetyltransferase n=1 Tax=Sporosarcina sp. HYO08 TaxID=1759557 RepID=UPI00079284CF|nr:GNAT family N-acetyltransferase [Sporosarcina sp. HYO08]KXH81833.1 GCN5 family acetyltransferase [Sporosarcina sp. HYO08]
MKPTIITRKLETIEELRLVQSLEKTVWGMDPIPIHQTYTAITNGGLMLGAFDGERLVGFSYSFTGFANGKAYLCSHMLGVHPDYQLMGIGKLLKDEQRKLAKEMGYELITWTFDPLESRNAYLNLSKLYGICSIYLENWYGEMEDGLNKGLPTDRFKIEWWIASERVEKGWVPTLDRFERPFTVGKTEQGYPVLEWDEQNVPTDVDGLEIPVPDHIQLIKSSEPTLALDWRLKIRKIFQTLFQAGYALVGVNRSKAGVHYYQVIKRSTIPLTTSERGDIQ